MKKFFQLIFIFLHLFLVSILYAQEKNHERYKIYTWNSTPVLLDTITGETWKAFFSNDGNFGWTRMYFFQPEEKSIPEIIGITPKQILEQMREHLKKYPPP